MNTKKSYIYLTLTILLWGSSASIIKLLLFNLNMNSILFYTILSATISLFAIIVIKRKTHIIKKLKFKDYIFFSVMGFVGVYLYYKFFYIALTLATTQEVFIINYTWALWIVIFSVPILKERITFFKIIALGLGIIGVAFIIFKNNINIFNIIGCLYAFLGAVSYGLFSVFTKKYKYDKTISVMFYYLFALMFILLEMAITGDIDIPKISVNELIGIIWIGVFCSGLGFVFWTKALEYGDISQISNIILLVPFVSLVYIYILLNEHIMSSSIIGLVLIVFGIIIQNKEKVRT
jgi:drug/metabolite transporter (DMT)-like permease